LIISVLILYKYNDRAFHSHLKKSMKQNTTIYNKTNVIFSDIILTDVTNNNKVFLKQCFQYMVVEHDDFGGLGHTFGALVFATNLAMEFGFNIVLHENLWRHYSGQNENYGNFKNMLHLENFLSYDEFSNGIGKDLKTYSIKNREEFISLMKNIYLKQGCNFSIHVSMGKKNSCNNQFCFSNWPGAYQRSKLFFKKNQNIQNQVLDKANLVLFHEHFLNKRLVVAWHIRCGDIVISRSEMFFININNLITDSNVSVHHFFFSERTCSEFDFLSKIFVNATFLTLNIDWTVLYMQYADILIHTGSSLPQTIYITGPQNGLFFESKPKELDKGSIETYHFLSSVNFNLDGNIDALLPGQCNHKDCVKQYIQGLHQMRYGQKNSDLTLYDDLHENYMIHTLNNSNFEFCLNMAKEASQKKGIWIVRLFYNISDLQLPLDDLRYQMNVELIEVNSRLPFIIPNKK